jgi:glycosyltransferase involved in cell wall biosynthesis
VPELRLYVANPGYRPDLKREVRGVVNLGALPHGEVIRHVRQSLCVFYPNTVFPETFGLVFAEANAVGTPVLTHDLGAAREVLGSAIQIADASDYRAFTRRVLAWREGKRPRVKTSEAFRLRSVAAQWTKACSPA